MSRCSRCLGRDGWGSGQGLRVILRLGPLGVLQHITMTGTGPGATVQRLPCLWMVQVGMWRDQPEPPGRALTGCLDWGLGVTEQDGDSGMWGKGFCT